MLSKMEAVMGAGGIKIELLSCMDGSEKMPLLVIGKTEKPGCFKYVNPLPCKYRHNSSAGITYVLFVELVTCFG
jgi:hypothetical protein